MDSRLEAALLAATVRAEEYRELTAEEVAMLELGGSWSGSWAEVRVHRSASSSSLHTVRHCEFAGCVYLHASGESVRTYCEVERVSGLLHCSFSGTVVIGAHCYVAHSSLHNCAVGERAVVQHCAMVVGTGSSSFGNGASVAVGAETGGRSVRLHVSHSYEELCAQALGSPAPPATAIHAALTVLGAGTLLFRCDLVRNCLLGAGCSAIESSLTDCTLWSDGAATSHASRARLNGCLLGPGCRADGCSADKTQLLDQASVGEGARVSHCLLGPDASVSGGECAHSVLGPFVGFHHQSLLIATLWPMGRGNLAYGAKVGANHTGRLNDQECVVGEGVFFGLGAAVKFPFNSLESPYSMVAPYTVCAAQKLSFPFSLVSSQESSLTCVIKPAWVLLHNAYLLDRSDAKFSMRTKAKAHYCGFPLMRGSVVDHMVDAWRRLKSACGQESYLAADLAGLGKCVLAEKDRLKAIDAYEMYIRMYALSWLLGPRAAGPSSTDAPLAREGSLRRDLRLFSMDRGTVAADIEQHKRLVLEHVLGIPVATLTAARRTTLLDELVLLSGRHAAAVAASRAKDDRGAEVIEDYARTHCEAEKDDVVVAAAGRAREVQAAAAAMTRAL